MKSKEYYDFFKEIINISLFRLKTGNVPPEDFVFEELQPGMEVNANTLRKISRSASKIDLNHNENNFQRKRELERKISIHEIEVTKGKMTSDIVEVKKL